MLTCDMEQSAHRAKGPAGGQGPKDPSSTRPTQNRARGWAATVEDIQPRLSSSAAPADKTLFSMFVPEFKRHLLASLKKPDLVRVGIKAHIICIVQTAICRIAWT